MIGAKIILLAMLPAGIFISGCYTKVMSPQEFIQTRRTTMSVPQHQPDNSSMMNFNQSCVTCHSVMELDERAEELGLYGIRTVHNGSLLAAHQWRDERIGEVYIRDPNPYWPSAPGTMNPWWSPTTSTAISSPVSVPDGTNRPRTDGATRDEPRQSGTYTQPQTPVGGTPSAPSTPATTTTVTAPPAKATPAPATDRNTNSSGTSNDSSSRTRTDGESRDDRNRPR